MNNYEKLGLKPGATADEIKTAYRKLAMVHHPDKGGDANKFREITEAYNDLLNPKQQKMENPFGDFSPFGDDMFENILRGFRFNFNRGNDSGFSGMFRKNPNLHVEIHISMEEQINGCSKLVKLEYHNSIPKEVELNIPKGCNTGDTIKYANLGESYIENIPYGDLFATIIIDPANNYQIVRNELLYSKSIHVWDALLGTTIELNDPIGGTFSINVPSGVKSGSIFRIKNRGLFNRESNSRGYILVKIDITMPKITDEQKEIIKKWL